MTMTNTFIGRTQHPGKWAGTPYHFDPTLSRDILDRFTTCMDDLPPEHLASIETIARGYGEVYAIARAFKEALGANLLDRAIEAAQSEQSFHIALAAPLMVWCLNHPWKEELYVDVMVCKWMSRTLDSCSSATAIERANTLMAQLLPLVPDIAQDVRGPFLAQFLQAMYRCATPWKNPQHAALCAHYLELSHALTQHCLLESQGDGRFMGDVWGKYASLALEETRGDEQAKLAAWLATSVLPVDDLLPLLSWGSAQVWTRPEVAAFLLPHLSKRESSRFEELPWSTGNNALATNQTLIRTYCPLLYPLLELALAPSEWSDKAVVEAWLVEHDKAIECLPLPDELSLG